MKPLRVHGTHALALGSHADRSTKFLWFRRFHGLGTWWRAFPLDMLVAAKRAVNAETEVVHVALLHFLTRVLEDALRLAANSKLREEAAHGHPVLIKLVEESTLLPFHTKSSQPVPTDRLPEILLAHVLLEPGLTRPAFVGC